MPRIIILRPTTEILVFFVLLVLLCCFGFLSCSFVSFLAPSHKSCGVFQVSVEGHWTYSWTYVLVLQVFLRLFNLDCRYPRDLLQPASQKKTIHSLQVRAGMWAWSSWHHRNHAAHKAVESRQLHAWLGTSCHLAGIEFPQLPAALTRRAKPLVQSMPVPKSRVMESDDENPPPAHLRGHCAATC